ncbi:heat-inducible transcriptional repressor HrcA [Flaviflexus salsibiostraticola]|uniref:Heat-inducible transcription repressor HrcA n=1 Tax=Flaviflexus salsibiostraticola TaxID=1282737 RepID=A0A3Q8WSW8_9ACTO|nr:heat-inducible transcriptional repressor HrcA [Flaviflexus salsibiostraticola]AZN29502.1 heat-inducible transcriptional repressor HrcA [Flaviflexus salsibiostraticola]
MRSDERRLKVLQAIVQDYVHTREPVGSKAIAERHGFDVSSATIRNDMAALEEVGLIHQPHTSAGRVPTDRGYRTFVDSIAQIKPLSSAEKRAIETWLEGAADLDDVVLRAGRLLAQLTKQVAVVQYPTRARSAVRHIELVPISQHVTFLIVISDSGAVEQRSLELGMTDEQALDLSARLNAVFVNRAAHEISEDALGELAPSERGRAGSIVAVLKDVMTDEAEERIVMAGTANLARTDIDFSHTITPVLEALEEQVVLLRLFAEVTGDLAITIGSENNDEGLSEASIVTSTYGSSGTARLGIVGPTRMDYPGAMVSVRAVARYLTRILGS